MEPDETVTLTLATGTVYTIGTTNAVTGTITNDDVVNSGAIAFSNSQFSVNEDGTPITQVILTRTGGSTGGVSATINLTDGTATAPSDYIQTPITVIFTDGETSKIITIPIIDDNIYEPTETVKLTLSNPTGGATLGTQQTAKLSIVDNEQLLFADNFDNGASSLWGNEVGNWQQNQGVYDSQNPNNNPLTYSSLPYLLKDFSIELDINKVQDGGIFLRSTDNNNGVLLVTGGEYGTGTGFYWHIIQNGVVSEILNPSASGLFQSGISNIHLKIEVVGDNYSSFLNDIPTPVTTFTTSLFSSGKVALYDFSGLQTFDNVEVYSDSPLITLTIASTSITEDGTSNLVYTFTRTGLTTNSLTVNYSITGTADATDYTGATPGTGKTITFAAGSATATLAIDPTADALVEPDETVILTLETGTDYTIGTNNSITGTIINDDTAIESAGNTKLIKDGANKYFAQAGSNTPIAIKNGTTQIYQGIYAGWQTLAAETVNSENQTLWKNAGSNSMQVWHINSSWARVSSETIGTLTSSAALAKETVFGVDANSDGVICTRIALESAGNTALFKDGNNKYFAQVGSNTPVAIKNGTTQIYQGIYTGWQTLAAETVNGENQTLWINSASNSMQVWHMNSSWVRVSSETIGTLTSSAALAKETVFGVDANGDGFIGSPSTVAVESVGNTSLVKDSSNKYFAQVGSNTPIAIKNGTTQIYQGMYTGWQTLAAETVNGENQILWTLPGSNLMQVWHMNSSWVRVSSENIGTLTSSAALAQETIFGVDANGDGSIGNPNSLTLTGTSGNDTLIGGANSDVLTGLGGKDLLTGGLVGDRFVYQTLTDSLLANYDGITDFNATTDRFLVSTTRSGFNNVGTVTTLDNAGISAKLTAANFGANSAASFTFGSRSFVAINDATAGFSQTTDAIIEVTGLTGTLGLTNFVTV